VCGSAAPASFLALTAAGNELTPDRAFLTVTLLNIMRFPLAVLPGLVSGLAEVRVSVRRLMDFLAREEIDDALVDRPATGASGCVWLCGRALTQHSSGRFAARIQRRSIGSAGRACGGRDVFVVGRDARAE
jgi:hypothetical protein